MVALTVTNIAANDQPLSAANEPSLIADIGGLISELDQATEGSAELDARIHFGFCIATQKISDTAAVLIEHGVSWPTVEAVMDEQIPAYTTSLDAALGDEDISFVIRSAKTRRWGAMQKAKCGEEVLVWASCEPLARRLAAICAWKVDAECSANEAQATNAPAAAQNDDHAETSGDNDWEVMF